MSTFGRPVARCLASGVLKVPQGGTLRLVIVFNAIRKQTAISRNALRLAADNAAASELCRRDLYAQLPPISLTFVGWPDRHRRCAVPRDGDRAVCKPQAAGRRTRAILRTLNLPAILFLVATSVRAADYYVDLNNRTPGPAAVRVRRHKNGAQNALSPLEERE